MFSGIVGNPISFMCGPSDLWPVFPPFGFLFLKGEEFMEIEF